MRNFFSVPIHRKIVPVPRFSENRAIRNHNVVPDFYPPPYLNELKMEYRVLGNRSVQVDGFKPFDCAEEGKLTWVKNWSGEIKEELNHRRALIVVGKEDTGELSGDHCYFLCSDPKMCFFEILEKFYPPFITFFVSKINRAFSCTIP